MKFRTFVFGFLFILVLSICCCLEVQKERQSVCEKPYIVINGKCCLDLNKNKICDESDVTTTTTILTTTTTKITTITTSTTTTTTTIIKATCYKNTDCGNTSYSEPFCYNDISIDKTYSSKNFIIPICKNPGNESAECVYLSKKIDEWLCKEKCVNGTCIGEKIYMI